VTSRDLVSNVMVDEDDNIVSIGKVKPAGLLVGLNVEKTRQSSDHDWRIEVRGSGYLPAPEGSEEPEEQPKAGKGKAGKEKKSKKAKASEDDDAPF
jgi:hypothetical protein